jgi:capsular polysaccharide biosynthesis protein
VKALSEADTIELLKRTIELRPVRNTSLIEVRVYSRNPKEASNIANTLVETYQGFIRDQTNTTGMQTPRAHSVEIVDMARPGLRPVRPNRPLTLFLGLFGGIPLALMSGAAGTLLVLLTRRLSRPPGATA